MEGTIILLDIVESDILCRRHRSRYVITNGISGIVLDDNGGFGYMSEIEARRESYLNQEKNVAWKA